MMTGTIQTSQIFYFFGWNVRLCKQINCPVLHIYNLHTSKFENTVILHTAYICSVQVYTIYKGQSIFTYQESTYCGICILHFPSQIYVIALLIFSAVFHNFNVWDIKYTQTTFLQKSHFLAWNRTWRVYKDCKFVD